jgi:hypothetical protein
MEARPSQVLPIYKVTGALRQEPVWSEDEPGGSCQVQSLRYSGGDVKEEEGTERCGSRVPGPGGI